MRFQKPDRATELCNLIKNEQRELANLEKDYTKRQSAWREKHRSCLELAALISVSGQTYSPASEGLFQQYQSELNRELELAMTARDGTIGTLRTEIKALKKQVFRRLDCLRGCLGTIVNIVINHKFSGSPRSQCSEEFQVELMAAHRHAESLTDPGELLSFLRDTIEKIENTDLELCPLANLDRAIQQALAVEIPAAQTVA